MSRKASLLSIKAKKGQRFFNRELSWLDFNQRVLNEANNAAIPLLERLKFLAITASNLDEFYMVRVGGLKLLREQSNELRDLAGYSPAQQEKYVIERIHRMVDECYALFAQLLAALRKEGFIVIQEMSELTAEQRIWATNQFIDTLYPVLSPVALEDVRERYQPRGLLLHTLVRLQSPETAEPCYALVPLGPQIPRFLKVPDADKTVLLPVEVLIQSEIDRLFTGIHVEECTTLRMTRNADIELREDLSPDLVLGMQEILADRQQTDCIRVEAAKPISREMTTFILESLNLAEDDLYCCPALLQLRDCMELTSIEGFDHLCNPSWTPVIGGGFDVKESIFPQIAERDRLLIHPYESFDPVVKLIEDAADDANVLAIKQVLYRTAKNSAIIEALIRAAQSGKHVTVLCELKARFDEARNITESKRLELAGVQVVYGVKSLKTHAKITLVIRKESEGIVKYLHFGTGNYNERTAKIYSDISFFTCNPDYGRDATSFFNAITGYSQPQSMTYLDMAPFTLRKKLIRLIEDEAARARNHEKAEILMKMNGLSDKELIEALYAASSAGVKIKLNVRGICCLRPGVPKLSENITVASIIDRYLEHARIFCFSNGGNQRLFIASADGMTRNLSRRVELLIAITHAELRDQLYDTLKIYFKDNSKASLLHEDGTWTPIKPKSGEPLVQSQKVLHDNASKTSRLELQFKPTRLEPWQKKPSAKASKRRRS